MRRRSATNRSPGPFALSPRSGLSALPSGRRIAANHHAPMLCSCADLWPPARPPLPLATTSLRFASPAPSASRFPPCRAPSRTFGSRPLQASPFSRTTYSMSDFGDPTLRRKMRSHPSSQFRFAAQRFPAQRHGPCPRRPAPQKIPTPSGCATGAAPAAQICLPPCIFRAAHRGRSAAKIDPSFFLRASSPGRSDLPPCRNGVVRIWTIGRYFFLALPRSLGSI